VVLISFSDSSASLGRAVSPRKLKPDTKPKSCLLIPPSNKENEIVVVADITFIGFRHQNFLVEREYRLHS
jgi:hypothetical protein